MAEIRNRIKRLKRQISDATETSESEESSEEYDIPGTPASTNKNMARPSRRSVGAANGTTSATISRSSSGSPEDRRQSIRLTVKAPPSKLREVMRVNEVDALKDVIGGGRIVEGPRRSRNAPPPRASGRRPDKPRYAEYGESDIEDEEDEEDEDDEEQDEDDEAEEDEAMHDVEADSDQDEEDEDQEMEDEPSPPKRSAPPPKPPKITLKQPGSTNDRGLSNPKLIITPAQVGTVKSVEEQEMEDEDEDEDEDDEEDGSSELSEDDEEDEEEGDEEQEETMQLNAGAEQGAGDELGDDEELEDDDEELESDDETPGSGTATPDMTKLTKRQRGRPEDSTELMALDMAPQQRKFFTDHEKAMKKDEHARKRKELTKRKIQEEKAAALNRLLKPQASKARGAAPKPETLAAAAARAAESPYEEEEYQEKANPLYTRWISTKDGIKLGVPEEWLGKRVGRVFGTPLPPSGGVLIQEL